MSFSNGDRKVRVAKGSRFPVDPVEEVKATLSSVVADALRRDFGDGAKQRKEIANLMGMNPRTVENWLQSKNGPNGAGLVVLMRHSDAVTAAVLDLAGRQKEKRHVRGERLRKDTRMLLLALLEHLGPE